MIKFLLGVIVVLALVGGVIQFKSTDKDWSLVIEKEVALYSVKIGAVKIYNISSEFIADFRKPKKTEEAPLVIPAVKK